ncbi:hypothetical protein LINPERHAP2_LOCUS3930 [Linum perenne]
MAAEHDDTVCDLDDDISRTATLAAEEDEDLNSVPSPSTPPLPAAVLPTAVVALPVAVPSASLVTVASAAPNGYDSAQNRLRYGRSTSAELRKPTAMTTTGANWNMITIPTLTPQPLDKSCAEEEEEPSSCLLIWSSGLGLVFCRSCEEEAVLEFGMNKRFKLSETPIGLKRMNKPPPWTESIDDNDEDFEEKPTTEESYESSEDGEEGLAQHASSDDAKVFVGGLPFEVDSEKIAMLF